MALTKAKVLKIFKQKYKYQLGWYNQYVNAAALKNNLWVAEMESLCERELITDAQLQGWKEPF